jgi:PadR family transcriptional regulator, regulatory protein PadR
MPIRITVAVAAVLQVFLDDVAQPRYGYELMRATGFASGKLYPILARLETHGWLSGEFEQVDPVAAGRPPRRWYRLTEEGTAAARYELAALRRQLAPARRRTARHDRPQPAGGPA